MEESSVVTQDRFEYQIGERVYIQKPLVLGQIKLITGLLKNVDLPKTVDVVEIVGAVQGVINEALSIVLIEESMVKAKPEELSEYFSANQLIDRGKYFEWYAGSDVLVKVVNDFLSCNPVASVLSLVRMLVTSLYVPTAPQIVEEIMESTGSTESVSTLQTET